MMMKIPARTMAVLGIGNVKIQAPTTPIPDDEYGLYNQAESNQDVCPMIIILGGFIVPRGELKNFNF